MNCLVKSVVLAVFSSAMVASGAAAQLPTSTPTDTSQLRQAAEARLGRSLSQAEILDRLRQSGMTRSQARARLQQLGYDPSLADQYFDAMESGGEPPKGAVSKDFLTALRRMGIVGRVGPMGVGGAASDTLAADTLGADTLAVDTLEARDSASARKRGELQVFGRSLFDRRTNQFAPVVNGPVDPSYRLGPGDQLSLILTGDVEQAYDLQVTREGYVVIPDVGQLMVNGLTMDQLDDLLYTRLGRVYSGVRRGGGATTHFQASLGRVRSIQVYMVGEVTHPGAYQVSGLSTVFDALYRSGGPSPRGSFRRIEVRRGGNAVRHVDLYSYLLHGDSRDDVRLEQGDIIFVPVADRMVSLMGAVRRPAIYELRPEETLTDAITYAGGLEANAVARRIQIDRVLPPDRRRPGVDRVLMDVDVAEATAGGAAGVSLQDADIVHVFAVSDERRHRVVLTGGVNRPGIFEWSPGTTLWQVIDRAQGLSERAYTPRAQIYRLNPEDGSRRLIRTPLLADTAGKALSDVALADRDSVVIFDVSRLATPAFVTIDGFVKKPGTFPLAEGMTLEDLVLAAGGFTRGAELAEAEIARYPALAHRSDTTAIVVRVPFAASVRKESPGGDGTRRPATEAERARGVPAWVPEASEFALQDGDRVFVRKAPGYELARQVKLTGEVITPGTYVLRDRAETVAQIVARAGGLTSQGYAPGFQLYRRGRLLPIDLARALKESGSRYDVALEPGDSLHVPAYDPTVTVAGDVAFESRVLYRPGRGLGYYIAQAGGYGERADRGRTSVAYANGERATVKRFLWVRQSPAIRPGATIFVPQNPPGQAGINWDNFLAKTLAAMSTLATVLIAIHQVK